MNSIILSWEISISVHFKNFIILVHASALERDSMSVC